MEGLYKDKDLNEEMNDLACGDGLYCPVASGAVNPEKIKAIIATGEGVRADSEGDMPFRPSEGRSLEEAIVLLHGRPVLFVRDGTFELPKSSVLRERLSACREAIDAAISTVGRIEVRNHPNFEWLGTGFLVSEDLLVTNRHVAKEFASRNDEGFSFRKNPWGRTMGARVDFREEYGSENQDEFAIDEVLFIAPDDGPDTAILRVVGNHARAHRLLLDGEVAEESHVVVIGYPAWDGRRNPGPDMRRIFGDVYDVKRVAPGQVVRTTEGMFTHDCSTLGGNSGSVVLGIESGKILGLHFAGRFQHANYAVDSQVIGNLVSQFA